jgi:hypothetical protein
MAIDRCEIEFPEWMTEGEIRNLLLLMKEPGWLRENTPAVTREQIIAMSERTLISRIDTTARPN